MNSIFLVSEVSALYGLSRNAVAVMRSGVQQLPDSTFFYFGKIYYCASGDKVEELMQKLEADGVAALGFNADLREISQCNV